jgi:hypothetical protein
VKYADDKLSSFLDPRQIEVYLLAHGWEVRRKTPMFSTWAVPGEDDPTRRNLFLPLSRKPRDFESRLREFVSALAEIEDKNRDLLINNLRYATADLVRIRLVSPRVGTGELPIGDGAELFSGARELMLAAACATVNVRPNFGPRKPRQATDYLDEVRLGQTEPGSYIVTVISDVEPPAQQAILPDDAAHLDIPFERRVTTRLATALGAARDAAHSVLHDNHGYGVFDDAVEAGVSANLCDAIATMGTANTAANILVSIDWASSRPPTVDSSTMVAFDPAALPVMEEAVLHLRQLGPFENELIEGFVSRLTRGNEDEIGTIVIEGQAQGATRNVHVELPDNQYDLAVDAHRSRRPVRIHGTLYKRGRSWVLSEPGQLAFEN